MITNNKAFKIVMYALLIFLIIACVMPFWMLFVSSLTSETALAKTGYNFVFTETSTAAYEYLWGVRGSILRAYGMSVLITAIGVSCNVVLTVLFAYPLSRKDLPGRKAISFFLFFTMLFNGGFVPTYMVYTQVFHFKDSLAGMIVPYLLMNAFYVMMMRTYITTWWDDYGRLERSEITRCEEKKGNKWVNSKFNQLINIIIDDKHYMYTKSLGWKQMRNTETNLMGSGAKTVNGCKLTKSGTATVAGKQCNVFKGKRNGTTIEYYIWEGVPMKHVEKYSDGTSAVTVQSIELPASIDASKFAVPKTAVKK